MEKAYLISVFVIATCGLVYELISGALASYLLGDSVTQFSMVIGVYLFSMGIGSYLSKFITKNLEETFIKVEIIVGLVGGSSAALLFFAFDFVEHFRVLLFSLVSIVGILVGLEIPLLMQLLKDRFEFRDLVAKVFTFDYVGALLASLLFPLVLVPQLGLVRSAFLFGILNVAVALWTIQVLGLKLGRFRKGYLSVAGICSLAYLVIGFAGADRLTSFAETRNYQDTVIYAKSTKYQRIVVTRRGQDIRLHLNGNLQFSSRDEYRYHESLIHPGLAAHENAESVLVLGGGDGMAVREILKYPNIKSITLVDLDEEMTSLFKNNQNLAALNQKSQSDKVTIINQDAFQWLKANDRQYDFIAVDFPDPSNFSIGKLYTNSFYKLLKNALRTDGIGVIQSTSPYVAKNSFWIINRTLESVGFSTTPFHAYVPSFGEWGFTIITNETFRPAVQYPKDLRFVSKTTFQGMLEFPTDMMVDGPGVNRLNNQLLVRTFEEEWSHY
ncbi:MAG: polyamine aminopropyltransferase [Proteobacteria bacterium]|nr:polyamine aminopropyltransferase [Pseudomonadota bacterium]